MPALSKAVAIVAQRVSHSARIVIARQLSFFWPPTDTHHPGARRPIIVSVSVTVIVCRHVLQMRSSFWDSGTFAPTRCQNALSGFVGFAVMWDFSQLT